MEVIGLIEVLKHWKKLKRIFQRMVHLLDSESPDAVFLVDYVGFNLRFAAQAKKRNIPVYFYISPQIWAWKKNRIQKIRDYVDKLIVLFPFEVKYFADRNVQVECFGHPLLDIVKTNTIKKKCFQEWNLSPSKKLVSLLPGSRMQEIKKHLPKNYPSILLKTICLSLYFLDTVFFPSPNLWRNIKINWNISFFCLCSKTEIKTYIVY